MKKALLGVVVVSAIAYVAWPSSKASAPEPANEDVVMNRIWIDHMPRNERDMVQFFVAVTEQPVGIFQAGSRWKINAELFQHEAHQGELRVYYGQTGEREKIKASAKKCSEKGMDYCLQLDGASRGVKKYYSMEEWVIDSHATAADIQHRIDATVFQ